MNKITFTLFCLLTLSMGCSRFSKNIDSLQTPHSIVELNTQLPIVNLRVDQDDFDKMYEEYQVEREIDGKFDLYRDKELVVKNEKVELEIKGNYSTKFPLKSLGVKFDDIYDNSDRSLINPEQILPHHSLNKIRAIRLRNSGNDFPNTMLKDMSFSQLAVQAGLDLDLSYGEPALVYINDEFYGLMNIRTESNTNGMAGLYEADKDDITLAKITTRELFKKDGDKDRIDALVEAIAERDLAYVKSEIDLDNFIDYMVFESYIANTDWPHNNSRFFAIGDGKFRFVLFDLDKVSTLKMNKSPLAIIEDVNKPNILTDLFFVLYHDEAFKENFWNRFKFLLQSGDISYQALEPIVQANSKRIESEIQLQIDKYSAPRTIIEWNIELDKLLVLFQEREAIINEWVE